ncbi:MAG: thiolase family protein [Paracoccaceae bacterium]
MTGPSLILSARRSPIAPRNGALSQLSIEELAAPVLIAAMADAGVSHADIDELIVANSLGGGGNPARIIALKANLPNRVAGLSFDRQCVGGLDALLIGDALIRSGRCNLVIAGGAESYSRQPLRFKTFADGRAPVQYFQARFTPWEDRDPDMAQAADLLAKRLNISRADQDAWAIQSHANAARAPRPHIVEMQGQSIDSFTRQLSDKHCKKAGVVCGDITAANMAVAADGAAFVVMASAQWAAKRGLDGPRLRAGCTLGDDPEMPGLAPVLAIQQALAAAQLQPKDITTAEIMEAFAVQAIACQEGAEIDPSVVNLWGGALARGHPIGASGAVLAAQLFHQMNSRGGYGLMAIAAAGGLGTAVVLEP